MCGILFSKAEDPYRKRTSAYTLFYNFIVELYFWDIFLDKRLIGTKKFLRVILRRHFEDELIFSVCSIRTRISNNSDCIFTKLL